MSRSSSSDSGPDGLLLVDKEPGESSRRAASRVARAIRAKKFGHAGTLDPFATGLLLVLVGRACRTQDWFTRLPKEYLATARLGAVSTTGDPEGEITETGRIPPEPLKLPTGRIRQRPPAYSAVHVGGRRAYELARAGEEVELPEREVEVVRFEETGRDGDLVELRIECSSGTYVRSLVSDLGDAFTTALRRTAVGPFAVSDADPDRLIPLEEALPFLPRLHLGPPDAALIANGRPLEATGEIEPAPWAVAGEAPGDVLLIDAQGAVAIARPAQDGRLRSVVGFRG